MKIPSKNDRNKHALSTILINNRQSWNSNLIKVIYNKNVFRTATKNLKKKKVKNLFRIEIITFGEKMKHFKNIWNG